ncbi:alpha/beta fold hydrolase [Streptomyces sp. YKOK-I1]
MTNDTTRTDVSYDTFDVSLPSGNSRYYRKGKGLDRTIVFLHGSGPGVTATSNWEGAIERLGDRFDCIAPDVLGFGHSAHPDPAPHGMEAFTRARVDALFELLDELGLEQVDLVGNSMGGLIALEMAVAQPKRIRRVTLMGSGGVAFPPGPDLLKLVTFYDDPTAEALSSLMRCFLFDPSAFGDLDALARDRIELAASPEVRRSHLATFSAGGYAVDPDALTSLPHPVQLIHGQADRIVPLEISLRLLEAIPDSRLHVLGRCGHWSQLEKPGEFDELIKTFHGKAEE